MSICMGRSARSLTRSALWRDELRPRTKPHESRDRGESCHDGARRDIPDDAALRGDARTFSDNGMIGHAHLSADQDPAPDASRAGEARLSGDVGVLADAHVVAHVHVRVELDASLEDRGTERPGVDGGERADLDVVLDHDAAALRDAHDVTVRPRRPAEPGTADDGDRPDRHAFADAHVRRR